MIYTYIFDDLFTFTKKNMWRLVGKVVLLQILNVDEVGRILILDFTKIYFDFSTSNLNFMTFVVLSLELV